MIFRLIDHITKCIIDNYSIRYFKKHRKDPPVIDFLGKFQYRLFGKFTKMTPRGKKKMMISAISVWIAWVILGRTDALDVILGEVERQFIDVQQWFILVVSL